MADPSLNWLPVGIRIRKLLCTFMKLHALLEYINLLQNFLCKFFIIVGLPGHNIYSYVNFD